MVGAAFKADAVDRAHRLPELAVGLHIVLVRGRPVLPAEAIPDLVGANGEFRTDLFSAGLSFFFRASVQRQLEAEIRAQFQAFRETGLRLDHANCHNHLQLHPSVLRLILKIGRDYGLAAVRLPSEPFLPSWHAAGREGFAGRLSYRAALRPWTKLIAMRLEQSGVACNDHLFGMFDSGQMTAERIRRLIPELPEGVSELHFHPAVDDTNSDLKAAGYRHVEEFEALIDPAVRTAFAQANIERIAFRDLGATVP